MDIRIGQYYVNKTWKYLRPCLRYYGPTFKVKFDQVFKLAIGIHDTLLDGTDLEQQRLLFILLDKKWHPRQFDGFMRWVGNQEYYVTDYSFDDIMDGRKQMVVLKFPEKFYHAYDKFNEGKYSEMYSTVDISRFFGLGEVADILQKRPKARPIFLEKLNRSFKTDMQESDILHMELDFPPEKRKEIFNYGEV